MSGTMWPTTADGRWLVLRTCDADMTSHGGFEWPTEGHVEAPDWDPDPGRECGGGLHGLLWGCGNAGLLSAFPGARWLVVAVDPADVADPARNKVRFRRGEVVLVGTRDEAVGMIADAAPGLPVVYAVRTGGDESTVTGGYGATVTGGYGATVTGGYGARVTGGDRSTVTGGDWSTVTGGDGSTLVVKWWDGFRYRLAVGYVGEDGIEAGVAYRCDDQGRLVRAVES